MVQNSVRHAVFTAPPETTPDGPALFALLTGYGCRVWLVTGDTAVATRPAGAARTICGGSPPIRSRTARTGP